MYVSIYQSLDPEDPEYVKNLQRPAEVKEDLQQMSSRSRVSVVLNSQAFKEELEEVVEEQLRSGPYPASLLALQQITDLLLPQSKGSLSSIARGEYCSNLLIYFIQQVHAILNIQNTGCFFIWETFKIRLHRSS